MGKFAAVYDLPAGEQLLVCLVCLKGQHPFFQLVTEIEGTQTIMNMPVTLNTPDGKPEQIVNITTDEVREKAMAYVLDMEQENIIAIRRMMVAELARQMTEAKAHVSMERAKEQKSN